MEYIIIDAQTGNCRTGFNSEKEAYEFIIEHTKPGDLYTILTADNYEEEMEIEDGSMKLVIAPMEWVENRDDAELFICDGLWDNRLNEHATFTEDLLVSDILETPDTPVKCFRE